MKVANGQLGEGGGQGCSHKELALQEIASQRRARGGTGSHLALWGALSRINPLCWALFRITFSGWALTCIAKALTFFPPSAQEQQ